MLAGGRRVNVLVSAAPIYGRGDRITGAIVGWTDVTELKELQTELDARRREAEESSLRKSRFLAAVSHDIRTPANAISLLAELMQRSATTPGMVSEIPEIATDLKRSALTLVNLVSDVLDLTRFDSGKVDLQESVIDVGELIDEECRQLLAVLVLTDPPISYKEASEVLGRPIGSLGPSCNRCLQKRRGRLAADAGA